MARAKRDGIPEEKFLAIYVPLAKEGKSLKEIAAAFGDGRDPATVSVRCNGIRSKLTANVDGRIEAYEKTKGEKLSPEIREQMYKQFVYDVCPFVGGGSGRRKKPVNVAAVDDFLSQLDGPVAPPENDGTVGEQETTLEETNEQLAS